jgi:hypothetical protein
MSTITECDRCNSIKINNTPDMGGRRMSVQVPADLVFAADSLFGAMCRDGETSPGLDLRRTVSGSGGTMWVATYGGIKAASYTPWGAIAFLGNKIAARDTA